MGPQARRAIAAPQILDGVLDILCKVVELLDEGVTAALLACQQGEPWQSQVSPTALANAAAALLAFAELDSRAGGKPSSIIGGSLRGSMQLAAAGAGCMRGLAGQVSRISIFAPHGRNCANPADVSLMLATQLRHVLIWLAQPTTPVATASAVLVEALAGLEALVAACPATQLALAEGGGEFEWAPVAAALRRRLPRRMAARFLPEVDRVSTAVAASTGSHAADVADAEGAMAALLQVRLALLVCSDLISAISYSQLWPWTHIVG